MMECTECGCWMDADGGDCQWKDDKPYCDNCMEDEDDDNNGK